MEEGAGHSGAHGSEADEGDVERGCHGQSIDERELLRTDD